MVGLSILLEMYFSVSIVKMAYQWLYIRFYVELDNMSLAIFYKE